VKPSDLAVETREIDNKEIIPKNLVSFEFIFMSLYLIKLAEMQ
jgi:hypothetical protein